MRNRLFFQFLFVFGINITAGALYADAPAAINYQGKLADSSGNPLTGTYSMLFELYANPIGGSALFIDDRTAAGQQVPVSNGLFTVLIGTGTTLTGNLTSNLQGDTVRYLQVTVSGNPLLPRQRMVASPYALAVAQGAVSNAEVASGAGITVSKLAAGNFPAGNYSFAGSTVTVSSMSVTDVIDMKGRPIQNLPATPANANDAASKSYVDSQVGGGGAWTAGGSNNVYLTNSADLVGLGTSNPAAKLHVSGSALFTGPITAQSSATFTNNAFSVGRSTLVVSGGKVGIGTTAPAYLLDVSKTFSPASLNALVNLYGDEYGSSGSYNQLNILDINAYTAVTGAGGSEVYAIHSQAGTTSDGVGQGAFGVASIINTYDSSDEGFGFYVDDDNGSTGGTQYGLYIRLDDTNVTRYGIYQPTANDNWLAGRVGIGRTVPSYQLHVSSAAGTTATLFAVSTGPVDLFRVSGTSAALKVPLYFPDGSVQTTAAGGSSQWTTNGANIGYTGGAVGIGLTDPSSQLEINDNADNTALHVSNPGVTSAAVMSLAGPLSVDAGSGKAFSVFVSGENYARSTFYTDGKFGIGPGGADTRDIFLSRNAAGVMKISGDGASAAGDLVVTGQVGIGTTSPASKLDIQGGILRISDIVGGADTTKAFIEAQNGLSYFGSLGTQPAYFGNSEGFQTLVVDGGNVGIGTAAPVSKLSVGGAGVANTGIYGSGFTYGVYGSGNNGAGVYGISTTFYGVYGINTTGGGYGILGNGAIGVYGAGGSYGVYGEGTSYGVYGKGTTYDFYAAGAGTDYGTSSSIRWKRDLRPIDNALGKVLAMRGLYYTWDEAHGGQHDIGMIAEEVGKYVPEIVGWDPSAPGYATGMDYGHLTPILVEAIKEQQKQIEELSKQVQELKKR